MENHPVSAGTGPLTWEDISGTASDRPTIPHQEEREIRPRELPAPSNPMKVFRAIEPELMLLAPEEGRRVHSRLFWRDDWMTWTGTHWKRTDRIVIRGELYRRTEDAIYIHDGKHGPEERAWAPNRSKIADVEDAAASMLAMDSDQDSQVWRGKDYGPALSCCNGILLLRERALMQHTPQFFTEFTVPMTWDRGATCPRWLRFLESIFPGDDAAKDLLQEWFGYVLSGRTDLQKMLILHGPRRSGKGTIVRVMKAFYGGDKFVAGPTMDSFQSAFGLSTLIGKPLAIVADARGGSRDSSATVERLLAITGEDTVDVDRKHRALWSGKLPTRLMILSNELPRLKDASGAIVTRCLALKTKRSFLGKEDLELGATLEAELSGILNWALAGLDRLVDQRAFTATSDTEKAQEVMNESASPLHSFIDDVCTLDRGKRVSRDAMFKAWEAWAEKNHEKVRSTAEFGRLLRAAAPEIDDAQPRVNGKRVRMYVGIGLAGQLCAMCGDPMDAEFPGDSHPCC